MARERGDGSKMGQHGPKMGFFGSRGVSGPCLFQKRLKGGFARKVKKRDSSKTTICVSRFSCFVQKA